MIQKKLQNFQQNGQEKTLGCYHDKERWKFWSLELYEKLVKYQDGKEKFYGY